MMKSEGFHERLPPDRSTPRHEKRPSGALTRLGVMMVAEGGFLLAVAKSKIETTLRPQGSLAFIDAPYWTLLLNPLLCILRPRHI